MKILIIGPRTYKNLVGGVFTHASNMLSYLAVNQPEDEVELIDTTYNKRGRRLSYFKSLRMIYNIDYCSYDVIYINTSIYYTSLFKLGVILANIKKAFANKKAMPKIIVQFHGGNLKKLNKLQLLIIYFFLKNKLKLVDKLRFLTTEHKNQFEKVLAVSQTQTERIDHCVKVKAYWEPKSFDEIKVLLISRFEVGKGICEFIECARLAADNKKISFYAAGEGRLKQEVIRADKQLANFHYLGIVDGEEKEKLFRRCNVFCLLSDDEGMPYALLESMAAGNIPVVTNKGAMGDIVLEHNVGFIIPKSSQSLYNALLQLQYDNDFAVSLSKCAHATIKKHYSLNNIFKLPAVQ